MKRILGVNGGVDSEACECGSAAVATCTWPVEGYRRVLAATLKVGDQIHRVNDEGKNLTSTCEVVYFYRAAGYDTVTLRVRIVRRSGMTTMRDLHGYGDDEVLALRKGICGRRVCEKHVREVDDLHHHCQDHWNSWEAVA